MLVAKLLQSVSSELFQEGYHFSLNFATKLEASSANFLFLFQIHNKIINKVRILVLIFRQVICKASVLILILNSVYCK